jgi:predicted RNase H-like HicB family nuclease
MKAGFNYIGGGSNTMKTYFYKTIIEPAEEGGYTAYVPKLPGCVSEGETYEETLANIKEALTLYLEVAKERNQEILEDNTHIAEMAVTI